MEYCSYTLIDKVGEGTFGYVWKAIDNLSADGSEIVAIKEMKKLYSSLEECLELPEVKALVKLYGDPNIVGLRKLIFDNQVLYLVFDYEEFTLYRLMHDKINLCTDAELLNGLLENRIGLFSESQIRRWSRQILLALAQMHRPGGYMHRDIKPDNLLVARDGDSIKIADFGQAREIDSKSPCSDYVTTRMYRAPEVLLNSVSYTSAVDMWAVGAIMAELYSFRPLFPGKNRADQLYKICSVIGSPTYESWAEGIQLANWCGYKFPQVHPYGISTMIPSASHEAIDLIKSLCSWDPKNRPTAMEALKHPYFAPDMRELPEATTNAKLEQRIYPNQTCFGEKLLGPFSPVRDITIEDMLKRVWAEDTSAKFAQRIYPNQTCFGVELFGPFSPVGNMTSQDLFESVWGCSLDASFREITHQGKQTAAAAAHAF
ncbi:cyclin-dependent kinase F-4-like [Papaver somniferum]|uniref:cyclin-dependent kinase F-4-like n=1 Tax=Papaver somniferum TaxID=3469 RepID=UPI000E6FCAFE|nr:cyclin-dependent kinase F-4-like [Papaver somniferum]